MSSGAIVNLQKIDCENWKYDKFPIVFLLSMRTCAGRLWRIEKKKPNRFCFSWLRESAFSVYSFFLWFTRWSYIITHQGVNSIFAVEIWLFSPGNWILNYWAVLIQECMSCFVISCIARAFTKVYTIRYTDKV